MVETKQPSHDDLQRGEYKEQYDALIWLDHDIKLVESDTRRAKLEQLSREAREALAGDNVEEYKRVFTDLEGMIKRSRKIKDR